MLRSYSTTEGRVDISETEFVRIYFSPESGFINSPIELIFENNTKGFLSYGNEFSLEYFDKENWTEIQLDINWEAILLGLGAGETRKGRFNLSLIEEFNNGKKGKYRYVKNFGISYDAYFEIVRTFKLYAELEIKQNNDCSCGAYTGFDTEMDNNYLLKINGVIHFYSETKGYHLECEFYDSYLSSDRFETKQYNYTGETTIFGDIIFMEKQEYYRIGSVKIVKNKGIVEFWDKQQNCNWVKIE